MSDKFIEIMSMLGNWVSGIGATAAVLYSVNTTRSGVKCYPKITSTYNKDIEIDLFNHKQVKAYITEISFEFLSVDNLVTQKSKKIDSLSKYMNFCLEPGQREILNIKFNEIMELYFNIFNWYKLEKVTNMPEFKIVIGILNGYPLEIKFDKSYYVDLIEKYIKHKERSIMNPDRGLCCMVPSSEMGKSDLQIREDRTNNYGTVYQHLVYLQPPNFSLINKLRLIRARSLTKN